MEESHRDAHEQVVDHLVRTGAVPDKATSQRVVKQVVDNILNQPIETRPISEGDLYLMDEEIYAALMTVWELEDPAVKSPRRRLLEIVTRLQRAIRVVHKYVNPYQKTPNHHLHSDVR